MHSFFYSKWKYQVVQILCLMPFTLLLKQINMHEETAFYYNIIVVIKQFWRELMIRISYCGKPQLTMSYHQKHYYETEFLWYSY